MLGEQPLRLVIQQYLAHYQHERNHQDLGNQLIPAESEMAVRRGRVVRRDRLGGLLTYYYRETA